MSTAASPGRNDRPRPRAFVRWRTPWAFLREGLGRALYWLPSGPRRVQIEVTNVCNLTCAMCPRTRYELELEQMELPLFQEILAALPPSCRRVILVGWGESLLHPQLFEMMDAVHATGREVQLTSNALLLRGDLLPRLADHPPDYLAFSLEGEEPGGAGHPLPAAVERLTAFLRQRRKGQAPYVSFQTTLHQGRMQDVLDVVRLAARLQVERVTLLRLDVRYVPGLARPTPAEEQEILEAAEGLGRALGVQIDSNRAAGRGVARHLYRWVRPLLYRGDRRCPKTYDYLYVNVRGEITPCCALPRFPVGRADDGFLPVWRGPAMARFRREQAEVCGTCDYYTLRHRHDGELLDPAQGARGRPTPAARPPDPGPA